MRAVARRLRSRATHSASSSGGISRSGARSTAARRGPRSVRRQRRSRRAGAAARRRGSRTAGSRARRRRRARRGRARRAPARAPCSRACRSPTPASASRAVAAARATSAKSSRLADDLRDAPVEHVDLAEVAEHDVGRLEIAVDDAARVRELDREADVDERAQQALAREPRRDRGRVEDRRRASCRRAASSRSTAAPSPSLPSSYTGTIDGCSRRP